MLIFEITCQVRKILFAIDNPILGEGLRLHNITLRHLGAEKKEGKANSAGGRSQWVGYHCQPEPNVTEEKVPSAGAAVIKMLVIISNQAGITVIWIRYLVNIVDLKSLFYQYYP